MSKKKPESCTPVSIWILAKRSGVGRSAVGGRGMKAFCNLGQLMRRSLCSSLTTADRVIVMQSARAV